MRHDHEQVLVALVITNTYKGVIIRVGDFLYVEIWALEKDNDFARFSIAMVGLNLES